jgi:hypothetical protein
MNDQLAAKIAEPKLQKTTVSHLSESIRYLLIGGGKEYEYYWNEYLNIGIILRQDLYNI